MHAISLSGMAFYLGKKKKAQNSIDISQQGNIKFLSIHRKREERERERNKTKKFHLNLLINSFAMLRAWFKNWKLLARSSSDMAAFKFRKNSLYALFMSSKSPVPPEQKHSGVSNMFSCTFCSLSISSFSSNHLFFDLFPALQLNSASNREAMTVARLIHDEGSCKT
jgi:hypothetical protein